MESIRLYWMSVVRSILFYAVVLAVCIMFPIVVCLGIGLFFLRFYRRQVGGFFASRGGWTGAGDGAAIPAPFAGVTFRQSPPFDENGRTRER